MLSYELFGGTLLQDLWSNKHDDMYEIQTTGSVYLLPREIVKVRYTRTLFSYKTQAKYIKLENWHKDTNNHGMIIDHYKFISPGTRGDFSVACASEEFVQKFCQEYSILVTYVDNTAQNIADKMKHLDRSKSYVDEWFTTNWQLDLARSEVPRLMNRIYASNAQRKLRLLGSDFYNKAIKQRIISDTTRTIGSINHGERVTFFVGNSRINSSIPFYFSEYGLHNLSTDAEKIGVALAIIKSLSDYYSRTYKFVIGADFPLDDTEEYSIRICAEGSKNLTEW